MKQIYSATLAALMMFSPLLAKEEGNPFSFILGQNDDDTIDGSQELIYHIYETHDAVARFSKSNIQVLKMSYNLLSELYKTFIFGEGMIDKDIHLIFDAVSFAAEKHRFQTRKDREETPYIIHPMGVAYNLLTLGKVRDPDILIAALLHDTVEDTATTFEEIRAMFGERVEGFVREVTDDKSLPKKERKRLQIEHAKEKSAAAAQIKLADKLYNLKDLMRSPPPFWSKERIDEYFDWAEKVVRALPWVNGRLKNAVDETIRNYREEKGS